MTNVKDVDTCVNAVHLILKKFFPDVMDALIITGNSNQLDIFNIVH